MEQLLETSGMTRVFLILMSGLIASGALILGLFLLDQVLNAMVIVC